MGPNMILTDNNDARQVKFIGNSEASLFKKKQK